MVRSKNQPLRLSLSLSSYYVISRYLYQYLVVYIIVNIFVTIRYLSLTRFHYSYVVFRVDTK